MINKLVSVIMPSYNSMKHISDAIDSVLNQTYKYWELIIVDDKSPDNANHIIKKYIELDKRIILIKLEENSGAAVARNIAIKEAKGRYIAFLDSDDLWLTQKLERQIQFMIDNKCALSYSNYNTINENGEMLSKVIRPPLKLTYNKLLKSNYIGCLTAIYDTNIIGKVYMPLIKKRQDYALWLKILKKIDFAYAIDENLATYRIMLNSISSNKLKLLKYNYMLFRKYENFSIVKSVYYLTWNIFIRVTMR